MAIVLEMEYSKKLGLPQFSSHSFGVTLRREVASLEDIDSEVANGYAQLQSAVDSQIANPGIVPGKTTVLDDAPAQRIEEWRCSKKQRELIEKLAKENKWPRDKIEAIATERFAKDLISLNKLEASGLIDELFKRTGGKAREGRSRQQFRRAA